MGAAIADRLAASGARVAVNSRTDIEATDFAQRLNDEYGNGRRVAISAPGDMTARPDLQSVVQRTLAEFGKITTLVLSPTIRPWFGSSIDIPDHEIDTQYMYVFKCRFSMTSLCIPHMISSGHGSVIYIGSGSAFEATSERSVYSCMRAAEVQMVKNFAAEYGGHNIRFNIISPGLIDANGSKSLFADVETVNAITAGMPMRRHGEVSEIAAVTMFLASDSSSFTTGAVIPVDGGRNLHAVPSRLKNAFAEEQTARMGK
jgi:3-oxoacyl-[acyl-carrier protein] reductase